MKNTIMVCTFFMLVSSDAYGMELIRKLRDYCFSTSYEPREFILGEDSIYLKLDDASALEECKREVQSLFIETGYNENNNNFLYKAFTKKIDNENVLRIFFDTCRCSGIELSDVGMLAGALAVAGSQGYAINVKVLNKEFERLFYNRGEFQEFQFQTKEVYAQPRHHSVAFSSYRHISYAYILSFDLASYNGHINILKVLIDSPYLRSQTHHWKYGKRNGGIFKSALHAAILGNRKEVVLYLLAQGAPHNDPYLLEEKKVNEIELAESLSYTRIKDILSYHKDYKDHMVEMIINAGSDSTSLIKAVTVVAICPILLPENSFKSSYKGVTLLHQCAERGDSDCFMMILSLNPLLIDKKDERGMTPLMITISNSSYQQNKYSMILWAIIDGCYKIKDER
ncbi:ankyrin repeat domain-containing protein [Candidatus Dependentiae bacterium]|nr:ankyrin repeat domain-containing protein [Candidatus Dependentiae bacterium]